MPENISDQNGRALEYAIVDHLKIKYDVKLSPHAIESQDRDKQKYETLSPDLKGIYSQSAPKIGHWINEKKALDYDTSLDRPTDEEGKKGDVTDIRLLFIDESTINLSIKHNHDAVKHQRPSALPQQCGYPKKSKTDLDYRQSYKEITNSFLQRVDSFLPEATEFKELKDADPDFINAFLYKPMCKLTEDFLNNKCNNAESSNFFFNFIVGTTDFYKVIVWNDKIEVLSYAGISDPTCLIAEQRLANYVNVLFSNNWELSMRLHTAGKDIPGVSLKYDTHVVGRPVPRETIFQFNT